ncbi:sirohydrochlorin chelatase [Halanaerobium salsuginis]|jgi:sirohydrochlorin ferrochelatase|uniref:CbiX protein n=1 Tax=Halanaerobium salsuginis TaxID=29563 RepID=A0A1I4JRB3_9FIRM|nr:CbiX/SirB N-terminal domain-containing protein [Halanaerobium salsuginis]SFL68773.1 CbiX protein [Halanaerobium salsuginis]
MKEALLVVSHGSKNQASRQEFAEFINKLRTVKQNYFSKIDGACLEFADPQLETAVKKLVAAGYSKLVILPLFIFAGYHVRKDIPERLDSLKKEVPELEYKILPHPASSTDFADYIYQIAHNFTIN